MIFVIVYLVNLYWRTTFIYLFLTMDKTRMNSNYFSMKKHVKYSLGHLVFYTDFSDGIYI